MVCGLGRGEDGGDIPGKRLIVKKLRLILKRAVDFFIFFSEHSDEKFPIFVFSSLFNGELIFY